ncbi:MAG TPA: hypothetical protein VMG62_00020 [Solirubrobacteraceae bacterium]|nr:hypothetical protein [Solirubrobacteraceae bacterium]
MLYRASATPNIRPSDHRDCNAAAVTHRPQPLRELDRYFAAARIAHEYVSDLHRELVELETADDYTRELLRESAAVIVKQMPALTAQIHDLERQWAEQELLDPPAAQNTAELLGDGLTEIAPELAALRTRQDHIVGEFRELIDRARRSSRSD